MRLSEQERCAIKESVAKFDATAKVYLFGSRVDDHRRGGDIDLLILSEVITERERRCLKLDIFDRIGEQKIDLVIAKDLSQPFVRIAYHQGIPL